ncbi:rod shape-determining protein MreC [Endothiovibrio diazotrophicus]
MTVDHRLHYLEEVRAALSAVVYPIRYVVDLPVTAGGWLAQHLALRQHLLEENSALHAEHLQLDVRLQKMAALEAENERLRKLLDSSPKAGERVLIAELLAVELDPYKQQIVVNKGRLHEVYVGQPLVDADGIMGQVIHVGPLTATAMLITDSGHATPVQVNRTGLRTIAVGTGEADRLELPYLPNSADLEAGDLLVTSGLGGRLPPGYPVAIVSHIVHNPGQPFVEVRATPTAHLDRAREVLLVWRNDEPIEQEGTPAAKAEAPKAEGDQP